MKNETRTAVYDDALHIEAYRFAGIAQPFPNHLHDHYVIGLMEGGERSLTCRGAHHVARPGDILLFNPGDSHACTQASGVLDYRALNISQPVMAALTAEVTGTDALPRFSQSVIRDEEAACCLLTLHTQIMRPGCPLGREEQLLLLLALLLERYAQPFASSVPACPEEIYAACAFMAEHCAERITLEELCRCTGLSRSTLIRAFTRAKGVTPYRYLEALRIGRARRLLEQGETVAETALLTGFSDQSHFTNCFSRLIGLTPGAYRTMFQEGGRP